MEGTAAIHTLATVIQWAVAPAFLLTGIAGILAVLATRLGRVLDRARLLDRRMPDVHDAEHRRYLMEEVSVVWRRIHLINWAIRLLVGAALTVCVVIMCLFISNLASVRLGTVIAVLFVVAMVLMVAGLVLLLIEVSASTRSMRQKMEFLLGGGPVH